LEEAAERAQARGAHSLAAEFAGHSVRLTPSGGAEAAGRRTRLQIEALAAGGEVRDALALVDRTIEAMEPGPARAELLALRWHIESDDIETATSLLLQALDEAGEETHLRCRLLAMLGNERQIAGDLPGGIEAMREASALAERLGDEVLAARVDATLWHFELLAGTPRRVPSGEVLWLSESEVTTSAIGWDARIWIVRQRAWAGDLSGAIQMLEAVRDASSSADLVHPLVQAFYDLAILRCWAGDLASAKLLAEEGVRWARDSDDPWAESIFSFPVALRAVWAEPVPVARPAVQSLWERARAYGMRPDIIRARWLDGLLALRSTELAEAANDLAEAVDVLEQTGVEHPAPYPVLPDAVEALARAGDLDGARGLLERLERQAAAVSSRWGEAVARRAHGALLLAAGDAEDSLEPLGEAAGTLERLGFHLDAARAVHTRGSALVRLGQRTAAADAFADARARFGALGAGPWATRASEELERVAPGRSAGALTATEAQVAALVADGRKNREISAALFVSVATVEAHLTRIYRKLGISSRSDLTRLVAGGELLPPSGSPEGEGAAGDLGETPSRRPRRPA
jgi:DNA-binding CsgD family transcriptional regulator